MEVAPAASAPAPMVEVVNNDYRCLPCVAVCNTRQMLEAHLSGKKHVAKIALAGGPASFKPITDLPDLPPTESLTPAGRKRKNLSAQGSFRCDTCEIDFPSAFPFESHMQGKKHMNKIQKKEVGDTPSTLSCALCSINAPSKDAYDLHVNGKKHLAKVAKLDQGGAAAAAGGAAPADSAFQCEDCNISTTNAEALELHKQGKKHLAKLNRGTAESFHCEFCDVTVTNKDIFETHRNGKKHAEKVRKIAEGAAGGAAAEKTCDVCQITVQSQDMMEKHMAGKKHQKKVSGDDSGDKPNGHKPSGDKPKAEPIACDACGISVTSQALMDAHLIGKKHLKKVGGGDGGDGAPAAAKPPPGTFTCDVCSVSVTCQQLLDMHMQGKKHLKATGAAPAAPAGQPTASPSPKKKYDPAELTCNICCIQMNSPQMMATHLAGKSHGKKMLAANEENASALATSLIQSVREQSGGDVNMADAADVKTLNGKPKGPAGVKEEARAIPPSSPGRAPRSRRAN